MQPLQICIGSTIRIGRQSWFLPYAGFWKGTQKNAFWLNIWVMQSRPFNGFHSEYPLCDIAECVVSALREQNLGAGQGSQLQKRGTSCSEGLCGLVWLVILILFVLFQI